MKSKTFLLVFIYLIGAPVVAGWSSADREEYCTELWKNGSNTRILLARDRCIYSDAILRGAVWPFYLPARITYELTKTYQVKK